MKIKIVYPDWKKLTHQPEFNLPPHGPTVFASQLPDEVDISFCNEQVSELSIDESPDLVALSIMLTCQLERGWEIADAYRSIGVSVIAGGLATTLHPEETADHVDSIFLGEAEGRLGAVIEDFRRGELSSVYDFRGEFPDISLVKTARRDILNRDLYNYRGVQMVDLIHASRGCKHNCFPCCTPYLGGNTFRPRPIEDVVKEIENIDNNRLFFVDNSLGQDEEWVKDLFREIAKLDISWISHPIKDDEEILDLAAEAGCWYVYQAIIDTSDYIKERIKRLKERGIGVEGTVILGLDKHDKDYIKRMVDFLLEVDLDLAEFTILTPFPHSPVRKQLKEENRILHNEWSRYTCEEAVFEPKNMTPGELEEMYHYAWETFYEDTSVEVKMSNLYLEVIKKEKAKGTYRRMDLNENRDWKTESN